MAELTTAKGVPYVDGNDLLTAWPGRNLDLANWIDGRPGIAIVTTAARDALVAPDLWTGKCVYNTTNGRLESYNGAHWQGVTDIDVVTDAQRDAFGATDTWTGHVIWNSTSNALQVYTGAGWSQVGGSVQTMTTAARTALAGDDLWTGRMIFDTTVPGLYIYDGAVWRMGSVKTISLDLGWKIAGAPVAVTTDEFPYSAEGPIAIPAGQTKTLVSVQAAALGTWTTKPTYKLRRFTASAWGDITGFGTTASPFNADDSSHAPTAVALADGDLIGLWIVNAGTPSGSGPWSFRCHLRVDVAV